MHASTADTAHKYFHSLNPVVKEDSELSIVTGTDRDEEVASDGCGSKMDFDSRCVHFGYGLLTDNVRSVYVHVRHVAEDLRVCLMSKNAA